MDIAGAGVLVVGGSSGVGFAMARHRLGAPETSAAWFNRLLGADSIRMVLARPRIEKFDE